VAPLTRRAPRCRWKAERAASARPPMRAKSAPPRGATVSAPQLSDVIGSRLCSSVPGVERGTVANHAAVTSLTPEHARSANNQNVTSIATAYRRRIQGCSIRAVNLAGVGRPVRVARLVPLVTPTGHSRASAIGHQISRMLRRRCAICLLMSTTIGQTASRHMTCCLWWLTARRSAGIALTWLL
jgi:hypothetical protein